MFIPVPARPEAGVGAGLHALTSARVRVDCAREKATYLLHPARRGALLLHGLAPPLAEPLERPGAVVAGSALHFESRAGCGPRDLRPLGGGSDRREWPGPPAPAL